MFHENTSVIHEVELAGVKLGPVEVSVEPLEAALEKALLRALIRDDLELVSQIVDELGANRRYRR